MFSFLNKEKNSSSKSIDPYIKIAALLIHAAKIDENYTEKEKIIVIKALINLGLKEDNVNEIIKKAEEIEKESNQILEFTKEIKNLNKDSKIKIVEELWKIIYSDNNPDIYENNLMRRLTGLLYLDPKIVGDIKEKIKNNLVK
jgi:Uncharacterized protein conserved in bacteria|tara:strand:+ start:312 stop:740 length:429 start_codon:yes stop_codon:yes gene_type:complete